MVVGIRGWLVGWLSGVSRREGEGRPSGSHRRSSEAGSLLLGGCTDVTLKDLAGELPERMLEDIGLTRSGTVMPYEAGAARVRSAPVHRFRSVSRDGGPSCRSHRLFRTGQRSRNEGSRAFP